MTAPMPKGELSAASVCVTTRAWQRSFKGTFVTSAGKLTVNTILVFGRSCEGSRIKTPLPLMVVIFPWIWRTLPGRVFHCTVTGNSTGNLIPKRRQFKVSSKNDRATANNLPAARRGAPRSGIPSAGEMSRSPTRPPESAEKLVASTLLVTLLATTLKTTKVPVSPNTLEAHSEGP